MDETDSNTYHTQENGGGSFGWDDVASRGFGLFERYAVKSIDQNRYQASPDGTTLYNQRTQQPVAAGMAAQKGLPSWLVPALLVGAVVVAGIYVLRKK